MMKKLIELSDIKKALELGTITEEEAAEVTNREDMVRNIREILEYFDKGQVAFDDTTLSFVANYTMIAWYIFDRTGLETGIDDAEYDKLKDILVSNGKEDFITLPVNNRPNKKEGKHIYPILRGSLEKVHYLEQPDEKVNKSRKTLDGWIAKTERLYESKTGKKINLREQDIYVFPKWDGVSVIHEFHESGNLNRSLTRGYTKFNTAEDVTHHFKGVRRPLRRLDGTTTDPKNYGMKTEIMVPEEYVLEYNKNYSKDYKQSRAVASGIVNSDNPDERNKHLVIMQLRYIEEGDEIEELCPEVFDHPYIRTKLGNIEEIEQFALDHRYADGLRCDGAVIYLIDRELRKILGRDNDINNFEVAYKFTEEYAYTRVEDVVYQVGLLGRITPVVKVEPVTIKGNKISSASLSTVENVERLRLAKGDMVKILYDIIPYATIDTTCELNRSGKKMIKPLERCPSCGEKVTRDGAFLTCLNPNCDCRKKGKILNYLNKLRILDISYASIDALYEMGVLREIPDLYKLKKHRNKIVSQKGFGDVTFDNWLKQIDDKRTVYDYVVLGSLGINGLGERNFAWILAVYSFDELMEIVHEDNFEALTQVKGIGNRKAKRIIKGMKDAESTIKFLWNELDIIHNDPLGETPKFQVCFTKIREPELEKYIISLGGAVAGTIKEDVDYLVVPNKLATSNKVTKAKKKKVKIITKEELLDILKKYDNNK